jgi:predicted AAA+ superfamily ATPase
MYRDIEQDLLEWKTSPIRSPLLLRGARQVGKSFIVTKFGEREFKKCVVLNFEQIPRVGLCFTSLISEKIIEAIELFMEVKIQLGETLLFLDEIQECPSAMMALRYFKEQMPGLHVIGAG